jgi:hypothetical protein
MGSNFYFGPEMYFQTGQVIFVPEWPKGEFVSILASFCVWTKSLKYKDAVNREFHYSESASQKKFKFPVSRPDDRAILSGRPSLHCSIHLDDVSSRPDARQTSIIRLDKVFILSRPHTVSRSFCANLHPSDQFSSMSGCLPVLDKFLISFQVPRKGRSINRLDDVVSCPDDYLSVRTRALLI